MPATKSFSLYLGKAGILNPLQLLTDHAKELISRGTAKKASAANFGDGATLYSFPGHPALPEWAKIRGQDQYGRTLGKVYAGGTYVNAEMVRSGAAWAYRDYLTDYSLVSLETEAHKAKRGLWAMPEGQTIAPWEWRHHRQSTPPPGLLPQVAGMQCGTKRYCRQMTSCDEARYYWQYCGVSSLDGDGDGRPCEVLCR